MTKPFVRVAVACKFDESNDGTFLSHVYRKPVRDDEDRLQEMSFAVADALKAVEGEDDAFLALAMAMSYQSSGDTDFTADTLRRVKKYLANVLQAVESWIPQAEEDEAEVARIAAGLTAGLKSSQNI